MSAEMSPEIPAEMPAETSDELELSEETPTPRFPLLADADWLRAQYQDAGWSLARIAEEVGCSRSTVRAALIRHDIPRRPPGPAPGTPPRRMSAALRGDNTSGYRGVTWCKRYETWQAQIQVAGKRQFLGYFDAKDDAARAYDAAAQEAFGEYARLNLADPAAPDASLIP